MITDAPLNEFFSGRDGDAWGAWRRDASFAADDLAFENDRFSVLAFRAATAAGECVQVMIRPKMDNGEPRWRDKQRIKNELFGEGTVAIEVMPPQTEVVAVGNVYHIWIMPAGFNLPSLV